MGLSGLQEEIPLAVSLDASRRRERSHSLACDPVSILQILSSDQMGLSGFLWRRKDPSKIRPPWRLDASLCRGRSPRLPCQLPVRALKELHPGQTGLSGLLKTLLT